jgi:predicted TIM-barrel fold metal-dependent hydrolase
MTAPTCPGERPSRRGFLATAATGAAAAAAASRGGAVEPLAGLVDAHVHVWSPDTARHPLAAGFTAADMQPPSFTPDELLAACRPHGVTRIVLIQMSFYGTDNSYMVGALAARPGVFGGVAVVDHARAGVAATMRALAADGVRGFRLIAGRTAADDWGRSAGVDAMWRAGADESLAMCLLADPEALPAILDRCRRFPRTPVVIDHFARIGMRGPIVEGDVANLLALAALPQTAVKLSAYYALGAKKPPYDDLAPLIRRLRDAFGADRLMWATDCPYQLAPGQGYAPSVELVRDRLDFLSPAERAAILRDTATRIFFRGLPAPA